MAQTQQTLRLRNPKAYKKQLAYMRKLTRAKRVWAKKTKAGLTTLSWSEYGRLAGVLKRHKELVKESEQIGTTPMLKRLLAELERTERQYLDVKKRILHLVQ